MVQPVAGARRRAGERGLAGVPGRVIELEPEAGDERRVVEDLGGAADEVGRDAAAGEEALEVDRRAADRRVAAAGPLDLGDLEAAALGRLGDRLGLEDVRVEGRRAVAERLPRDVERVVRRAVDARPRAGGQRVPAGAVFGGACVRRPLPVAKAPLRRNGPIVGSRPSPTYFLTASWRSPSAAKNTALSLGADGGDAAIAEAPPSCDGTRRAVPSSTRKRRDGRDTGHLRDAFDLAGGGMGARLPPSARDHQTGTVTYRDVNGLAGRVCRTLPACTGNRGVRGREQTRAA